MKQYSTKSSIRQFVKLNNEVENLQSIDTLLTGSSLSVKWTFLRENLNRFQFALTTPAKLPHKMNCVFALLSHSIDKKKLKISTTLLSDYYNYYLNHKHK